ncbi:hypothetical protein LUZ61_013467 [Rhynchospora tenuis]|uniref:Uncharacterized protein n=1 Tax=Rhynchospora tenuis TaxID=198213 RepID=A0AAD5WC44_9POAL|nr:hypothetical protein LUZ61_013467 [Rhynchospora tenuis]
MAGTIAVSTLVKIVGEKLGSKLLKEFSSLWGVKNDLEALESAISTIRDVLDDAEQYFQENKPVYNWLMKLKEVVYDADDLLDKIYLEAEKEKSKSYGKTSKVGNFISNANPLKPLKFKLVNKIKSINKRLDAVAAEKEKYLLGGLGKTTLAQLAYNEDELKEYFNLKIWVYVSQDFNIGNIVTAMMDSVSKGECKLQNPSNLAEELQKYLNGKRFLIVLDDIWNENQEEWEKLKVILKCGAIGRAEYPNWMMVLSENNTEKFPYLTSLTLSHFKQCSSLSSLAGLSQLKYLKLEGMLFLTNYSGHFPSLDELHLCEMPNLEEVKTMKLDTENVYKPAFPRLSKLVISGYPKVRIKPHLPTSVVKLELEKSNEELLGVEYFNGESSSEICSQLLGIRELRIRQMETELVLLKHLSSLTRLQFGWCKRNCLPESMRHLSSLRELDISGCRGLHALPEWLGELKSLEQLEITWTPLACLPESMKHMSFLRELWFWNCHGLHVLPEWFGELKSLKDLIIRETPLTCLPRSMKQLTALQCLVIGKCPELERRCEREKGDDWHLISHIPSVSIW